MFGMFEVDVARHHKPTRWTFPADAVA
jgi:hypothetical protein